MVTKKTKTKAVEKYPCTARLVRMTNGEVKVTDQAFEAAEATYLPDEDSYGEYCASVHAACGERITSGEYGDNEAEARASLEARVKRLAKYVLGQK